MTALSALGFALLVIALRAGVPRLLFPAFGALGASTTMNLPLYGVANAFPSHEGMVMSLLNGAFDASCIVFVVFAAVVQATGADLSTVALGFLVGPVAALLLTSGLLWRDEPFMHPHVHGEDEGEGEGAVAAAAETPGGAAAAPLPLGDVALDVTEKAQAGGTLPQLARQPPASTGTPRAPPSPALPSSELPRRQDSSGGAATARSSGSSSPTPRRKPTLAAAFAVGSSRHIARGAARQLRGAASRQDKDGGAALAASGSLAALSEAGEEGGGAWSPSMSPRLDGTPVSPMMQGEAASPSVSPSPGGGGEAASPSVSPLPASGGGPVSPMMIAAAAAAAPDAGLSLAGDDALPAPTDAENAPPSSAVDVVVVVSASVSKSFPPHPHSSAVAATAAASDHPLLAPQHPEGGPRRASVPVASIDFSSVDGVDYGRLQSLPFIAQVSQPLYLQEEGEGSLGAACPPVPCCCYTAATAAAAAGAHPRFPRLRRLPRRQHAPDVLLPRVGEVRRRCEGGRRSHLTWCAPSASASSPLEQRATRRPHRRCRRVSRAGPWHHAAAGLLLPGAHAMDVWPGHHDGLAFTGLALTISASGTLCNCLIRTAASAVRCRIRHRLAGSLRCTLDHVGAGRRTRSAAARPCRRYTSVLQTTLPVPVAASGWLA